MLVGILRLMIKDLNYGNRVYGTSLRHTNYAKMAEGLGAYGIRVEKPEDLEKSISEALKNTPSVVDVVTSASVLSSDAIKRIRDTFQNIKH